MQEGMGDSHSISLLSAPVAKWLDILREDNMNCVDLVALHKQFEDSTLSRDYTIKNVVLLFHHGY